MALGSNPTNNGGADSEDDTPSDAEAQIIDMLYPSITRSRDQAHREERLLNILETIAAMDEPEQSEKLGYMNGLLDGMQTRA